jgi:hypothetical protein
MLLVSYYLIIKSKAMKVRSIFQKDPGACCGTGSDCCNITDWGCC